MEIVEFGTKNSEVIILLHGGGLSWWNFRAEAELLAPTYHVVLPILDGHAGSDEDFQSIRANAQRIISFVDQNYHGKVFLIGGLSLGAQILVEMLTLRNDICHYAIIERANVIPSKLTNIMIPFSINLSYGLIQKPWFSKLQFQSLKMDNHFYPEYYRDTRLITKANMISFLEANTSFEAASNLKSCQVNTRIVVGAKENGAIKRSAKILHEMMPHSTLEIKKDLYHGQYPLNCPQAYVQDLID
ncbi:alpha/beta fold hydrolase [Xylocopilactobacillus apicola]|uniref:Alpha/beta hydrolase n=1 Tax=Xylocopilactobacillus apicola TaxID=2932184 RepID=A0AAU9DUN4_9LACO|nr:alpha/beta hydrolase [Xylocopilactobacillus apicola]BDR59213.1 alpha/beta hydrolase [Xylocopilactobacillus apicola]